MRDRLDRLAARLTYANVMSTIAVLAVLGGGTAMATGMVTGDNVQDGTLTGVDIRNGSVGGTDIRNGSVGDRDIRDGSVGSDELADDAIDDSKIDHATRDRLVMASVPSGRTIRGVWGSIVMNDTDTYVTFGNSLPIPAPVKLTDDMVNFAASVPLCQDCDETCAGSYEMPTAPAGKLCLYLDEWSNPGNTTEARGYASPNGTRYGFYTNFGGRGLVGGWGSWAYTAP